MMTAELKLFNIELDKVQYSQALFDAIEVQMKHAARAWLRAIIIANAVPVYTGTARGTLKPLATFLRVSLPNKPIAKHAGRGPEIGSSYGSYKFTKGYISTFEFTTTLPYYLTNEFYDVRPTIPLTHNAPWHSFNIGKLAFRAYMKDALAKKMPEISSYLLRGRVIRS